MPYSSTKFPQFPDKTIFISLFTDIDKLTLETVKRQLIEGNSDYDFAFLNCNYIISQEHLFNGIHKAMVNDRNGTAKAKTLNTEIIFSMSPINNIMDALKRFGVDSSKDQDNLLCIKIVDDGTKLQEVNDHLLTILNVDDSKNPQLTNEFLSNCVDVAKFKKLYKLNDAIYTDDIPLQDQLTRLAIGACLLRGA